MLSLTLIVYLLTVSLAIPGGFLLNRLGLESDPWLLGFVLSATSLGVLLPILKEREMTRTSTGKSIFYSAMLADFLTVSLLTVFIILLRQGSNLEILSIGLLFVAFFVIYRFSTRFFRIPLIRNLFEELSNVTVQIKVRGAIAILMAFVVLALVLGVELILGAFLAGMIITLLRRPEDIDLVHRLDPPVSASSSPSFSSWSAPTSTWGRWSNRRKLLLLPLLFVIAMVVKIGPALLFKNQTELAGIPGDGGFAQHPSFCRDRRGGDRRAVGPAVAGGERGDHPVRHIDRVDHAHLIQPARAGESDRGAAVVPDLWRRRPRAASRQGAAQTR